MIVPDNDLICRLIDPERFNFEDGTPGYQNFTASHHKLTLWHQEKVEAGGESLDDLCVVDFAGWGQAILSVATCRAAVRAVPASPMDPTVIFSPEGAEGHHVRWADAHTDLVTTVGDAVFPRNYRKELAFQCCIAKPPTKTG